MASLDEAGRSDSHYAAAEGRVADLTAQLDAGEDPSLADHQRWGPLHFAARSQRAEIARVLVRSGASVDASDVYGKTPLVVALFNVRDGNGEIIQVLLQAGADPDRKNHADVSPRDLAQRVASYDLKRHLPPSR